MPWNTTTLMSQRLEFVQLALADRANIRSLCRRYDVCAMTAYKWIHRFGERRCCCTGGSVTTPSHQSAQDRLGGRRSNRRLAAAPSGVGRAQDPSAASDDRLPERS